MSSWSQQLRNDAGTLRGLAGRLEADPLRPVYGRLDEVWMGPAATELTEGGSAKDREADSVAGELRRVASNLDRRAREIEAAERAAEAAALAAAQEAAAMEEAADTAPATVPGGNPPATLPPSWY